LGFNLNLWNINDDINIKAPQIPPVPPFYFNAPTLHPVSLGFNLNLWNINDDINIKAPQIPPVPPVYFNAPAFHPVSLGFNLNLWNINIDINIKVHHPIHHPQQQFAALPNPVSLIF
jgi:hypothetical protein